MFYLFHPLERVKLPTITKFLPALGGAVGCTSDWRPGGRGSTPAEVGNILSWRLIMKYFLQSFSPFH